MLTVMYGGHTDAFNTIHSSEFKVPDSATRERNQTVSATTFVVGSRLSGNVVTKRTEMKAQGGRGEPICWFRVRANHASGTASVTSDATRHRRPEPPLPTTQTRRTRYTFLETTARPGGFEPGGIWLDHWSCLCANEASSPMPEKLFPRSSDRSPPSRPAE